MLPNYQNCGNYQKSGNSDNSDMIIAYLQGEKISGTNLYNLMGLYKSALSDITISSIKLVGKLDVIILRLLEEMKLSE